MSVPVLLITGTVGVGKSVVAGEISDALAELEIPNAAVDLDALICQWPPSSEWNNDLMFENLASLWPNYLAHGATRLVLARVLEDPAELARYRAAVPGAQITVCRLVAPEAVRVERLLRRMLPGPARDWHLHRTVQLEDILDRAGCEEFTVENGGRPVREVANEVLVRAGWIAAPLTQRH
jgi:predicted kinase